MYKFILLGNPVPWASARQGSKGFYDIKSGHKKSCLFDILSQKQEGCISGPVRLKLTFVMPIPKSASKKTRHLMLANMIRHTTKPDLTNLTKLLEDVLEKANVFSNDSQVVEHDTVKIYGEIPQTVIEVYLL